MCRHGYERGFGRRGVRRLSREEWIRRLEEYQRDLEEEIADVVDVLRRRKADPPQAEPTSA